MKKILDTVVFGGYTVQDVLILIGVVVALLILFRIVKGMLKQRATRKYSTRTDCPNCGWHGRVSTFAGRCPKCNQPLGEQSARARR